MDQATKYFPIRRSTRLPLEVPIRVTSTDGSRPFAENCNTVTVSAHGCGVISPRQLASGTTVQLEIVADKQSTPARVLEVVPLNDEQTSWLLGMELERPGNFWGIKYAPADWAEEDSEPAARPPAAAAAPIPQSSSGPTKEIAEASRTGATHLHIHRPISHPKPGGSKSTGSAGSPGPPQPASAGAAQVPASKPAPVASKEISPAVLRRLLSECRLAAISVGACYVQTGTTFPMHAPVKLVVQAGDREHSFHGSVRVEHVGAGMGIEFSGTGDEHAARIAALIDALSANGDKIPVVRVELAAPDKKSAGKSKSASSGDVPFDELLNLILVGGSYKRSDFLQELEKQRRRG